MPGSPVDVKVQSRATPPTMPPPPPSGNQGGTRPTSFTPTSLPNGVDHSPPALNGVPSPPQRFNNGPSSSLASQQLPATCGARQLSKLKRFLTTLQQFGNDISPEIGERVRSLVLALVNSTVTIEEFHSKLQEATNFPLRPFVIPFLKANLPLLQRELLHCARSAKQTPAQYLAQHEHLVLNANATSPVNSTDLLEVNENGKRSSPERNKENGFDRDPPAKRVCTISPAQRHSPNIGIPHPPNGQLHPTPPPLQHYSLDDVAINHLYRDPQRLPEYRERHRHHGGSRAVYQEEMIDHRLTDREWAEEWKHLDHLLNCIMDMVEKTRRSLAVLCRCQEADREELNYWMRRYNDTEEVRKGGSAHLRQLSPGNTDPIQTELHREISHRPSAGYVPDEIWKKADSCNGGNMMNNLSTLSCEVPWDGCTTLKAPGKCKFLLAECRAGGALCQGEKFDQHRDAKVVQSRKDYTSGPLYNPTPNQQRKSKGLSKWVQTTLEMSRRGESPPVSVISILNVTLEKLVEDDAINSALWELDGAEDVERQDYGWKVQMWD
ncbi:protein CBFA2T1-like [Rhincodon typus]|uniref:protein CBFA2T1-like n=1 Tax=Rhincodon typus TaxID=259920 RepID=UPI00202F4B20|nr:protein CBFA2T1-like [Rhincodon typus]